LREVQGETIKESLVGSNSSEPFGRGLIRRSENIAIFVQRAQQFLETKAKVLFQSQTLITCLLLLAIPMTERLGEETDR